MNSELRHQDLNEIVKEVDGKIEYYNCNDSKDEWKKVVIIYGNRKRSD